MADTKDLKSFGGNSVPVRVRFRAFFYLVNVRIFGCQVFICILGADTLPDTFVYKQKITPIAAESYPDKFTEALPLNEAALSQDKA